MIDVAFELMSRKKKPVTFLKLWEEICEIFGFNESQSDDNIAQFYSDLSLDDRFVTVGDNKWDLRSRHTYNEVVIDTSAIIIDENDEDEEELFSDEDDEESKKDKEEDF